METVSFVSHGTRCAAWWLPGGSDELVAAGGRPCVVMGHGFAATRDAGLLPFAEHFAAANLEIDVLERVHTAEMLADAAEAQEAIVLDFRSGSGSTHGLVSLD